jgi:hypothetical protein
MSETHRVTDFIGGAYADRTRDLLNAICSAALSPILLGITRHTSKLWARRANNTSIEEVTDKD